MAELKSIDVTSLFPHPDNPRLVIREDVVSGIAANLNGTFPPQHAIHVRPLGDGYQIISGHHRVEAAKLAGMKEIAAWVEHMNDEAAFMALVLSNAQGELSPLEIGMHALKAVPKSEGGRGKRGGLSEYAKRIGRAKQTVSEYMQAGEVVASINCPDVRTLLDKTHHLAAIHAAPTFDTPEDWPEGEPWLQPVWQCLVDLMLARNLTVADCKAQVSKLEEFVIPEEWTCFLVPPDVMCHYLKSREFSPRTVAGLIAECNMIAALLEAAKAKAIASEPEEREAFYEWLAANAGPGGESWDARKITEYRKELEVRLNEKEEEESASWNFGPWQDHIAALEDQSVSLLLTDPPYGIGYQSDYRLDRTKPRKHKVIDGDDSLQTFEAALVAMLPKLATDAHVLVFCQWRMESDVSAILTDAGLVVRGSLIWAKNNTGMGDPSTTFAPKHERILHAVKGSPKLYDREADVLNFDRVNSNRHPTEKPLPLLARLIEVTTAKGEIVADPFGGVASTLVAAKQAGRRYWGCELDDAYYQAGKARIEEMK